MSDCTFDVDPHGDESASGSPNSRGQEREDVPSTDSELAMEPDNILHRHLGKTSVPDDSFRGLWPGNFMVTMIRRGVCCASRPL
jgi:hypothetical protein